MLVCTPVRLPVAHPYVLHQTHKCGCICFHLYTVVWAFIPSVIGFSASSSSVVGLRRPFSLFVIGCSRCAHGSWRSSAQIMSSREFCFTASWGRASYRSPAAWQKKVMQRRKLAYANLSVVTKEQGWSRVYQKQESLQIHHRCLQDY